MQYDFSTIEAKWRKKWDILSVYEKKGRPTYYCLDMFPYPSGSGLHVGHWRGYVLSDAISRYKVLNGYHVLHPMGWDAFGLPAENDAIYKKIHPRIGTENNIANAKRQLKEMSTLFDWSKEINTTDPSYYKWTQWIFIKMFEAGLAYEKEMPLNWCPDCKTVLSNEEAVNGSCERCGAVVGKKMLRQWMLKITKYAERLLTDLKKLDWPEKVKKMQSDWIGKSYGSEIDFAIYGNIEMNISVYTTRPDTLYGTTFIVLSPEHKYASKLATSMTQEKVNEYILNASMKSNVERLQSKEKSGVFTGSYAVHPLNGKNIPIWLSDYVLSEYGTGAIMCVPAHDERDYVFAKKFELPIIQVIAQDGIVVKDMNEAYLDSAGIVVNSEEWNGMESATLKKEAAEILESRGIGKKMVNYKIRDWVFSRQRYWGEPIPLIHCEDCGVVTVPENQLPVLLPDVENYMPTDTGESPLAKIDEWVNVPCPKCGKSAKRETNTMPQWAGSSWYFLRYADPYNDSELAGSDELKKWLPVDMYVGGVEHAVLHLLYARFYTKFLYDIGMLDFDEPFIRLFNQGMITKDSAKMSKSKGNVVSPDILVNKYGCDSLRLYELFVGPPELDAEWNERGIEGVYRYLCKVYELVISNKDKDAETTREMWILINKMIYDITNKLENLKMNTIISGFMEYTNKIILAKKRQGYVDKNTLKTLVILLSPFAPHMAEELWEILGGTKSVFSEQWPDFDFEMVMAGDKTISLQVNGKYVSQLEFTDSETENEIIEKAKCVLMDRMIGKKIIRTVFVKDKVVNLIVRSID